MQEESDHYLNGNGLEAERCSGPRAVFFTLIGLSWASSCSLKCCAGVSEELLSWTYAQISVRECRIYCKCFSNRPVSLSTCLLNSQCTSVSLMDAY